MPGIGSHLRRTGSAARGFIVPADVLTDHDVTHAVKAIPSLE
jgi:hypothetical protein